MRTKKYATSLTELDTLIFGVRGALRNQLFHVLIEIQRLYPMLGSAFGLSKVI